MYIFYMILYVMTYSTSSCLVTKLWIQGMYICMYVLDDLGYDSGQGLRVFLQKVQLTQPFVRWVPVPLFPDRVAKA
jgi:hypothetical protein